MISELQGRGGNAIDQYVALHLTLIKGKFSNAVAREIYVAFQAAAVGKRDGGCRVIDPHIARHVALIEIEVAGAAASDIDFTGQRAVCCHAQVGTRCAIDNHVALHLTLIEGKIGEAAPRDIDVALKRTAVAQVHGCCRCIDQYITGHSTLFEVEMTGAAIGDPHIA